MIKKINCDVKYNLTLMIFDPDVQLADFVALGVDFIVLLSFAGYSYFKYGSPKICNEIEKTERDLYFWRIGLYSAVLAGWLMAFFTVAVPSPLKYLFHLVFLVSTMVTLWISLPAWICKKRNLSLICACDIYKYNDFELMLLLGVIGSFAFLVLPSTAAAYWLLAFLVTVAGLLYVIKPEKKIEPLKYPRELALHSLEELQEFLMTDPYQRKLITVLKAECDFCKLQAEEVVGIPDLSRLYRVIDLTDKDQLDPFILEFLNFEDPSKIKVPTSVIIDNGMSFDRKDGVLTRDELMAILSGF